MAEYTKAYRQTFRVADDSLERYELYVGEDAMPDFDDSLQPVATSATLPFSYTPSTPSSDQTIQFYAVTRKRNKYNILSHNQYPTIVEINELGEEELGPLTAPEIVKIMDGDSGEIFVRARYPKHVDRNEADTWELYVEEGIDPDPDVDTPVETEDMESTMGVDYQWRVATDGLTPGLTYHVMVVVSRSDDSTDEETGESSVTEHTCAETYDIDAEDTSLFGGQEFEIGS